MREASDGGVKVTTTGEYMDGTPINGSFTAKYDGKEYPVTGAPWDTISIKQIGLCARICGTARQLIVGVMTA